MLDDVRDTHDRDVITRNGRPEAVIISVSDLETIEETLDLLSTPGAIDEIRTAEAEIARGEAIGADELRRLMTERVRNERDAGDWPRCRAREWPRSPGGFSPTGRITIVDESIVNIEELIAALIIEAQKKGRVTIPWTE